MSRENTPFNIFMNLPGVIRVSIDVWDTTRLSDAQIIRVCDMAEMTLKTIGEILYEREEAPKREREAGLLKENRMMILGLS